MGVITDFKAHPQWNPFITRLLGGLKVGSVHDVVLKIPGRKDTRFTSRLLKLEENRKMLFMGTIIRGLLTEEYLFSVESLGENMTRLFQSISLKEIITPFASDAIRDTHKGLEQMNSAAKVRCEANW